MTPQDIDKIPQNIVYSVGRFGYTNPVEAELYLGPLAWKVVTVHGGWSQICENLGVNSDVEQEKQKWMEYLVKEQIKASCGIPPGELNGASIRRTGIQERETSRNR